MKKERIHWIDIARGIGILLVIYGHALPANSYRYLIYAFHMPLFFFLSGIVFHHRKYESFFHSVKRDLKKIILPYFLFAFISFILWILINHISQEHILYQLKSIFYGNGNKDYLVFNNILWFLPCLFVTKTIFGIISYVTDKDSYIVGSLLFFSVIGYFSSIFYPTLKLPFGAETALTAVVFFGAGYIFNKHLLRELSIFTKYSLPMVLFSFVSCFVFATVQYHFSGYQIDMRQNRLYDYFYFYGGALSGILFVLLMSFMLHKQRLLEYIGRNSMSLFVWHLILFSYFTNIITLFIDDKTFAKYRPNLFPILYSIMAVLVILAIRIIWKKLLLKKKMTSRIIYLFARTAVLPPKN